MKIDGTSAENKLAKYFNVIFYLLSLLCFGQLYLFVADSESPKKLMVFFPYSVSFLVLLSLSKYLNGNRRKKALIVILTIIIPWLCLLMIWFMT